MAELHLSPRRNFKEIIALLNIIDYINDTMLDKTPREIHFHSKGSSLIIFEGKESTLKKLQNHLRSEGSPGGKIITDKELKEKAEKDKPKKIKKEKKS